MADVYRIFGAELSPYSVKVRSYFRYKGLPHEWIVRSPATMDEYRRYAKLPLIPLLITPQDEGIQDSTPIIERMEAEHPEPSIEPDDPALAFLSALVEEFADEWGNKWMFHYRWWREVDQRSAAQRLARTMLGEGASDEQLQQATQGVRERMVSRLHFVGSSEQTVDQIEGSYRETLELVEAHLASRPYLFGAQPSLGDFGLWGQLYECWSDPTPGEIMRRSYPNVVAWVQSMLDAKAAGAWQSWAALAPTLGPLLQRQLGALFLPWTSANARALEAGESEFSVELAGRTWTQGVQKYHARSLAALRSRYAAVADRSQLDPILESSGCLAWLR